MSNWENARVTVAVGLRTALAVLPVYSLVKVTPSSVEPRSMRNQLLILGLMASSNTPQLLTIVKMVSGAMERKSVRSIFLPISIFVGTVDILSWGIAAASVYSGRGGKGKKAFWLRAMACVSFGSSFGLSMASIIRAYNKAGRVNPTLLWSEKIPFQFLAITIAQILLAGGLIETTRD